MSLSSKILAQGSPWKIDVRKLAVPIGVVLARVDVDGLGGSAVHRKIGYSDQIASCSEGTTMPWVRIRGSPPGDFHAGIELAVKGGLQQIGTAS